MLWQFVAQSVANRMATNEPLVRPGWFDVWKGRWCYSRSL